MACPIDVDGFFVVKGYVEISSVDNVDELKKVVFPVFVLPIRPILIGMVEKHIHIIYLWYLVQLFYSLIYRTSFAIQKPSTEFRQDLLQTDHRSIFPTLLWK